jgi:uncharacterized membrane protein
MTDNNDKINQLLYKLESLLKRQDDFYREINILKTELHQLKTPETELSSKTEEVKVDSLIATVEFEVKKEEITNDIHVTQQQTQQEQTKETFISVNNAPKGKSDFEKFIGENLINKIGIAITIIGVAIGAKYSIENNLISPLTRIILGYMFGFGLLGFGIKLKVKYENYSAVLVSGAMAIMYFITYSAYSFYDLIPQIMAFAIMLIFTVFTVIAALNYNKQVIAHIGLVGAYAVPILLSEGSGNVTVLFSYMTILNIGILTIAFKKYWKPLYYVSFGLTWKIFLSWYTSKYLINENFGLALAFASIFFAIFYLTFLAYKIRQKEKFVVDDVFLLMINSFIFYGVCYSILSDHESGKQLLGLFSIVKNL